MYIMFFKKKDKVLVRVCIGCVLPHNAILIGQGNYQLIGTHGKINEQYYDYEIEEDDLVNFLNINSNLLIKSQLLDIEKKQTNEEDKKPVKKTTLRGWSKKETS